MSGVDVGGEFVVAATHVLEGVPCTDHVRWTEPFQAAHGPQPGLQPIMIPFQWINHMLLDNMQAAGRTS
jgi:hypothetical protein